MSRYVKRARPEPTNDEWLASLMHRADTGPAPSKNGGNNGSDPQIREEIRMAAASSRARISWPCATKFERPNLILWRSHEIRSFDDHNTEAPHSAVDTGAPDGPNFAAVPRNSPVVV